MLALYLILFGGGISFGALLLLLGQFLWRRVLRHRSAKRSAGSQVSRMRWWHTRWVRGMALGAASLVLSGLYASFALAQPTLQHLDPLVFVALQLSVLVPVAAVLIGCSWRVATKACIRLGLVGGVPLGVGFVCIALSLRAIGIIPTAMLTALDGMVASLLAWLLFRQPPSAYTCLAMICAAVGALVLWWIAPSYWQSDLVALGCGVLFAIYAFHVERTATMRGVIRQQILPFFGGLFLSMAATALVCALCFGDWGTLHTATWSDWGILLYCGLGTVLVPLVTSTLLLRYLSPVTWAFLAVLEPLLSLLFATLVKHVSIGSVGWWGIGLIVLSVLVQAHAERGGAKKRGDVEATSEGKRALADDSQTGEALAGHLP